MRKFASPSSKKSQSPLHHAPFIKSNFNPLHLQQDHETRDKNIHFYSTNIRNQNQMLSNADLLRGFKSTFLKSEDYDFRKGKFTKELEKKTLKSSHKKSSKSIKKSDTRAKMDDNLKACLDNIYNANQNSFQATKEAQRKHQKNLQPQFKSDRSILEGANLENIQKLIGKKILSGRAQI